MATKADLEAKVAQLERQIERLQLDMEWERLCAEKRVAALTFGAKKRGTPRKVKTDRVKLQKAAKANGIQRDIFGQKVDSFAHMALNVPIIRLIERQEWDKLNADYLSRLSGGQVSRGRFQAHLTWLRRQNYI